MGKGDKKTAKGKRARGSYGITRQRSSSSNQTSPVIKPATEAKEEKVVKKPAAKKTVKKSAEATEKKTATTAKKATPKKAKEE